MRKPFVAILLALIIGLVPLSKGEASLGGVEDYSNPRIVPMYNDEKSDWVAYSAFLYSPRILFTVAHGEYYFDNNGNRIYWSPLNTYAGLPNSKAEIGAPRVKVIKRIISKTYRFDNATLGDFAVFVLEKDLANVEKVALLTPEIEAELVAQNVTVNLHGYGAYSDSCTAGQTLPCKTNIQERSKFPRLLTAKLYSLQQVEQIVGYQRSQLKGSMTYFRSGKESLCSGDSGGSNTIMYKGQLLYLTVTGNGMNSYGCGAAGYFDGVGGILYSTPVYEHLDIIKEAEDFVAEQLKLEAASKPSPTPAPSSVPTIDPKASPSASSKATQMKITITCVKGKTIKKITGINPKCPAGYKKK